MDSVGAQHTVSGSGSSAAATVVESETQDTSAIGTDENSQGTRIFMKYFSSRCDFERCLKELINMPMCVLVCRRTVEKSSDYCFCG